MKLDREEFERLALEQIDMVDRMARTLTRNAAEADDLVQETYLRAIRSWESFDLKSFGIRPWLLRILHNLHVSRATREAKQPQAIEAQVLHNVADTSAVESDVDWEPSEDLKLALDQLSTELRVALTLWAVDELTYQEIAAVMEVPIGTVMSRLHRARTQLRQLLKAPQTE